MWNNQQNGDYNSRAPPFPGAPAFPTPFPGGPAPNAGYNPGYAPAYGPPPTGYGSPPGPPLSGYGPPPGPPPQGYPQHGGYAPPPGQPPHGGYPLPSGPPPVQQSSYPGQQYHQQHQQPQGGGYPGQYGSAVHHTQQYAPPSGPPPPPPTQQQHYGPQVQGAHGQTAQPFFQYSQCNGKKKALCIGINYFGQQGQLRGCINDVQNIVKFLTSALSQFGYKKEDIVILTDDQTNPRAKPTGENILTAMQWLVRGASPNDSLFFHCKLGVPPDLSDSMTISVVKIPDMEAKRKIWMETKLMVIYPVDFKQNGHIVDDVMHDIMVKPLPAGCRLTAIFDSCHSGSALDLPYIYSTEGKIKEPNLAAEAGQGLLSAVTSYARGDMGGVFKSALGLVKTVGGGQEKANKISRATRTSPADVISWSGCKDSQTSADTQEKGQATGAMSYAFTTALGVSLSQTKMRLLMLSVAKNKQQSYQSLLVNIRDILKAKYEQKPQLSSSHPIVRSSRLLLLRPRVDS
ncbi:hypothetical protein H0H87_005435 [Tephrocybe sp. NHM501043]|nr:hypothetical protein H0H87_005435 [Tephrocybe sp. NHM501043]